MRAAVVVPAASRGLSSGRVGRMEGRVAIVTASTAGIGLAIAQKLGEGETRSSSGYTRTECTHLDAP